MTYQIPFNKASLVGNELNYIREALDHGHISGDGAFTKKCNELLEGELGASKVLLTTSCTHALELAALLLNIQPDDEVIVPSFTFVSTANAFVLRGARIVFADIRPDTLNLDEGGLDALINKRTKAIVPVHYAGVSCEMDTIGAIAHHHSVPLVEDNAHGFLARYKGKYTGTFGSLATQSFHETKNVTCGEGGALVINDPELVERAMIIREKGTNRSQFLRGQVDKYTWVDVGSSYLPSDILAAFLFAQLEARHEIQIQRRRVWSYYKLHLQDWADHHGVRLPIVPSECEQAFHMFYLMLPSLQHRQALISHLKVQGILSVFHYVPLHLSDMGRKFGAGKAHCPVTEDASSRLLRLPFYNHLTEAEQAQVVSAVIGFSM